MKYTYFQINPFKENEYSISHYLGFLQNFLSIKKEITFSVTGNSNNIKLIVKVPNKLKTFFENSFYAIFSESELKEIDYKEQKITKFINFSQKKDFEILNFEDFTKKGLYTEPFKDILHLFNTIPSGENLEVSYITKFKNENTIWDILLNFFLKLFGVERENPQDKIKVKIAFSTTIKDKTSKESLNHHLKNTFSKFIKNGEVKISKIAKAFFCDDNQFVNFYHILNKEFFIKNLVSMEIKKPVDVVNTADAKKKVSDIQVIGNPDMWVLLTKASSKVQNWMKSTKAMEVEDADVLVQVSTQVGDKVAEALQFIPGAKLEKDPDGNWRIVKA